MAHLDSLRLYSLYEFIRRKRRVKTESIKSYEDSILRTLMCLGYVEVNEHWVVPILTDDGKPKMTGPHEFIR